MDDFCQILRLSVAVALNKGQSSSDLEVRESRRDSMTRIRYGLNRPSQGRN